MKTTNENGLRLIDFAGGRQMTIESTFFMHKKIHLALSSRPHQIGHCMVEGRHFSDVIDVKAQRGANIDLDHIFVVITLRAKICRAYAKQRRGFAVVMTYQRNIATS
jgi:hypothetical protein